MSNLIDWLIKNNLVTPDIVYAGKFINPYLNDIREYQSQSLYGPSGLTVPKQMEGQDVNPAQDNYTLLKDYDRKILRKPKDRNYWVNRKQTTQYHELDHILANRTKPDDSYHPLYDMLGEFQASKLLNNLRNTIEKNKEKIIKKYPGIETVDYIHNPHKAPLSELMATLNSVEDNYKVDLLKDPLINEAFSTRNLKDAYRASTGYRRTRMDANDPSPYTMDKGFWMRLLDSFRE